MFYGLQNSVGFQLTLASRVNERAVEGVLSEYGLTRIMWALLVSIGINSLSRPSSIADFLGLDRPTVSRALTRLEENDLVLRKTNPSDGRQISVHITKVGNELLQAAAPKVQASVENFFSNLTVEERETLAEILRKLNSDRPTLKTL